MTAESVWLAIVNFRGEKFGSTEPVGLCNAQREDYGYRARMGLSRKPFNVRDGL